MGHLAHTAALAVGVEARPSQVLTKRLLGGNARRARGIKRADILCVSLHDVPVSQRFAKAGAVHCRAIKM